MPKQRIREIDLTGNITASSVVSTVYIPLQVPVDKVDGTGYVEAKLCKTITDIENYTKIGDESVGRDGLAYQAAVYLIQRGMYVLAQKVSLNYPLEQDTYKLWDGIADRSRWDIRFITTGDFRGFNASALKCAAKRGDCTYLADYEPVTGSEVYTQVNQEPDDWPKKEGDPFPANKYYKQTALLPDSVLTAWPTEGFKPNKYFIKPVAEEQNYYLLASEPADWGNDPFPTVCPYWSSKNHDPYSGTATSEQAWEKVKNNVYTKDTNVGTYEVSTIRSYFNEKFNRSSSEWEVINKEDLKYAAAFAPDFKSTKIKEGEELILNAYYAYLFSFINSLSKNNAEWLACAGSFRGSVPELTSVLKEYSNAECEILQARSANEEVQLDEAGDNIGFAINPIATVRPFGYIIWGNRTLVDTQSTETIGTLKATNFLNIRQLISTINKELYNASRKYTFEQNTNALWANFQNELAPTLDKMKSGNGILDYRWRKGTTTKKARLVAVLRIIPIEALEDFDLTIELADSLEVVE